MSEFKVFMDCETNGFCQTRNDIISLAMIVTDNDLNIKEEFYTESRPEFNKFYSEKAEEIHGFSKKQMESFKPRKEACVDILKFLKPFKDPKNAALPFIFHANGNFDYKFLKGMFMKEELEWSLYKVINGNNLISTLKLARDAGFKKNKLSDWSERIGFDLQHHEALSDTRGCYEVYKHLTKVMI